MSEAGDGSVAYHRIPLAVAPGLALLALAAAVSSLQLSAGASAATVAMGSLAVAVAVWALVDLERFVLVAVLATMVLPYALLQPGGAQVAAADLLLVVALGAWLVRASAGAAPAIWTAGNRMLAPGLLFVAANAASLAWSVAPRDTVETIVQMVEIVVVIPLAFASLPRSVASIRRAQLAFVGVTCVLAVVTLAYFAPRAVAGDVSAQYLPGLHKNAIGSFLAAGLVLAYAFWLSERRLGPRALLAAAMLLELAGMFAAASRGALIGAAVAIVVVSVMLRRGRLLALGATVAAGAVFLAWFAPELTPAERAAGGYASEAVRGYAWDNALEKLAERPLLGSGAGTYNDFIPEFGIGLIDPTNMFLLTGAELGVLGLVALLFLLWRFAALLAAAGRLPGEARVAAVAAGAMTLSLLVHFQVDVTWSRGSASVAFAGVGLLLAATRLATAGRPGVAPAAAGPAAGVPAGGPPAQPAAPPRAEPAAPAAQAAAPSGGGLRVVHVVTSDAYAGVERHALRLARELRRLDCRAELACPPGAARLRAEAGAAGVPVLPSSAAGRRGWIGSLARLLAAEPPDVLHLHDGRAALAGVVLARAGRPLVVRTQHFTRPASAERRGLRRDASLTLHRALNRRLDGYVAVSESVARAARERAETGMAEIAVVPPGIDLPGDDAVARARAGRERLAQPVVACIGRLERDKRADALVRAVPHVLARLPGTRFVIAGSGSQGEALRTLAAGLGVEHAIDWLGEVPDAAPVLAAAHVYVNPSPQEGFGLATVEAMAAGLPVVAVGAGASAELVEHGVSGLLAERDDPELLARHVAALLGDRALAARMGEAARARALARYGIERTAAATLELYLRLGEVARP